MIKISFIICHRADEDCFKIIEAVKSSCLYAKVDFQIILVSGNCPSYQRNNAVEKAIYSWLYFLDNDSHLKKKTISIVKNFILENKNISLVGGPSLLPTPNTSWQFSIDSVLTYSLLVGNISSRYCSKGEIRETDESELILCNMLIKKESFENLNGFNSSLYPNEENEFMTRLKKNGEKLYYLPQMIVYRNHRKNLKAFIKQMYNYGRGRAEQIKMSFSHFRLSSLISLTFPVIFIFLLFSLFYENFVFQNHFSILKFLLFKINDSFFVFYFGCLVLFFSRTSRKKQQFLFAIPIIIFCCHFFYGIGIWLNLFKKKTKADKIKKWFKITSEINS